MPACASNARKLRKRRNALKVFYLLVLVVIALDQFTKFLALNHLASQDSIPVIPGIFHLTFVFNRGIAFGLFHEKPGILLTLISISLGVLLYFGMKMRNVRSLQWWALGLILGGAVGNWIDRIRFGAVVDFLDFRVWPVFNIADSAITIGVVLYLFYFIKGEKTKI